MRNLNIKNPFLVLPIVATIAITAGFFGIQPLTKPKLANANGCQGVCVNITPDGMEPNELVVKTGEYVQFNTADNQRHNLSLGKGAENSSHGHDKLAHDHDPGLESGEFGPGEAWHAQFKKAGTYVMHDHKHPANSILIVVYDAK